MKTSMAWTSKMQLALTLAIVLAQAGTVLAQVSESSSSPAGLAMLVLFLGIVAMIGVLVIRWSQSSRDDEESA